jgi:cytochrome c oxidase subunit 2
MSDRVRNAHALGVVVLFALIAAFTVAGFAARSWLPPAASRHAAGVDGVIRYLLWTTGAVLVIGHAALVAFLWRYRGVQVAKSPAVAARTERLWSLVPVIGMALIAELGVLVKGLPVWAQVYGPPPDDALVVEVTAKQFEWWVRYPGPDGRFGRTAPEFVDLQRNPAGLDPDDPDAADDVVLRNALHVPAGRAVHVRLRSRDVLHSFWIPAFRVKQDVVPGITGHALFVPTEPGEYEIGCAELCGMGHYRMRGRVVVHTPDGFERWQTERGRAGA